MTHIWAIMEKPHHGIQVKYEKVWLTIPCTQKMDSFLSIEEAIAQGLQSKDEEYTRPKDDGTREKEKR